MVVNGVHLRGVVVNGQLAVVARSALKHVALYDEKRRLNGHEVKLENTYIYLLSRRLIILVSLPSTVFI